jgi:cytidylate kinase
MAVITISRQYGSGGDEVATRLCEMLGYNYFHKGLMAHMATEMGLSENQIVDFSEDNYTIRSFLARLLDRRSPRVVAEVGTWREDIRGARVKEVIKLDEDQTIMLVQTAIEEAHKQGNFVIVGRGGQAILKEMPDVLHVRVEAPLDVRVRRVQEQKNLSLERAREMVHERDQAAADYLKRFYDVDWSNPLLYHVVFNMGKWDIEAVAQLIAASVAHLTPLAAAGG